MSDDGRMFQTVSLPSTPSDSTSARNLKTSPIDFSTPVFPPKSPITKTCPPMAQVSPIVRESNPIEDSGTVRLLQEPSRTQTSQQTDSVTAVAETSTIDELAKPSADNESSMATTPNSNIRKSIQPSQSQGSRYTS